MEWPAKPDMTELSDMEPWVKELFEKLHRRWRESVDEVERLYGRDRAIQFAEDSVEAIKQEFEKRRHGVKVQTNQQSNTKGE